MSYDTFDTLSGQGEATLGNPPTELQTVVQPYQSWQAQAVAIVGSWPWWKLLLLAVLAAAVAVAVAVVMG